MKITRSYLITVVTLTTMWFACTTTAPVISDNTPTKKMENQKIEQNLDSQLRLVRCRKMMTN